MIDDTLLMVVIATITMFVLVSLSITLIYVFYNSKSKLEKDMKKLENEVSKSQLEIREEFMRNVGKELHDNIGQVLSTVKLQLSMSKHKDENEDSITLIGQTVNDIRNLSKVVDPDAIKSLGLVESCRIEIDRMDKIEDFRASFNLSGTPFVLDQKVEIIIFRIIQESLNNCIKHAKCDKIDLSLHFDKSKLLINLRDHGVGFDTSLMDQSSGSGLNNMRERAEIIGASFKINSHVGEGTSIEITYEKHPINEQNPNRYS